MRLRRQLVIASLFTLILPWAGLQYIAEMETSLRSGQMRALTATAQAISRLLASDTVLANALQQTLSDQGQSQIYLHPLLAAPIVDGYDDEWRHFPFAPRPLQPAFENFGASLQATQHGTSIYLYVRVKDSQLRYHNPARDDYASGDHLRLDSVDENQNPIQYFVTSGAPGKVQVAYNDGGQLRQEYRISGYWQERSDGYQVELQLPLSLLNNRLRVSVNNRNIGAADQIVSSQKLSEVAATLIAPNVHLNQALRVFAADGLGLYLLSSSQWVVAHAGLALQGRDTEVEGWPVNTTQYQWLWRWLLVKPEFPPLSNPLLDGYFDSSAIAESIIYATAQQWYQHGDTLVGRAFVPVVAAERLLGFVVVEQSDVGQEAAASHAVSRLLRYTLLALLVVGAGLLGYASWLSWRIRRLSRAADAAVNDAGKDSDEMFALFPQSAARDEIGDLSRSYRRLLLRLQEYTDYLRSLSNKLSHELRTPLAVVTSSLDNLDCEPLPEAAKVYAKRAQEGALRLSAILNALSAASRVEQSIAQVEPEIVELDDFVRELARAYSDSFGRQISTDIKPEVNYRLAVVPELLAQLLDKLVDNAVDFCPDGDAIVIALCDCPEGVELSLRNAGPLLPAAMQQQLFDSLVSVRSESSGVKPHLGLGLHIVRLIAQAHGARVSAANLEDGSGVVFKLILQARN